jgi:FkbM family methyltransferase
MGKAGAILKKRLPKVYAALISVINAVLRWNRPYTIYITDSLGGSFKDYLLQHDMAGILAALKRGLDADSVNTVDIMLYRMLHYPDERYKHYIRHKKEMTGRLLPHETKAGAAAIGKELKEIRRTFKGFSGPFEDSVFYFFHGLKLLPFPVQQYVKGHDFMDLGAFVGDSSIALSVFEYRKIYAVELSGKSISRYRDNMSRAGIRADRYEIIQAAIAENAASVPIRIKDTGSAGLSGFRNLGKYDEIDVYPVSADDLVRQYAIRPRFIKVDIEGFGLEFVKGALETIRTHRPVLSVAIYHNPYEFFEVKTWLESHVDGYVFMIRKLSCGIRYNECHSETVLLGYPAEIS